MSEGRAARIADLALVALAFVLPLSIAASEILLGVAVVAWLVTRPWRAERTGAWRALVVVTLALAGSWLLASAFAADPAASLVKARKLWSIVLVFLVADRARDGVVLGRVTRAALAGGVASALLALGQVLVAGLPVDGRMRGVFSTAMTSGNVYALLALAALGVLVHRTASPLSARAAFAAFLAIALALFRTFTRSSWVAFFAGTLVLLARRPRWLLALVLAGTLGLVFGPATVRDRVRSIGDPTYATNQGRVSLWKSGWAVVADHPWTGVGLADHYDVIERYRRPDATFHAGHFHNNLVQVAASTGWIGFVAWAAWMALVALLLARALPGTAGPGALVALAAWVAFQVSGLFDWTFGDAEVALQFYLWVGLGLVPYAGPKRGFERKTPSFPGIDPGGADTEAPPHHRR